MTIAYLKMNRFSIPLVALLLSTFGVGSTAAQECYSDDDCDENEHCDLPPSVGYCEDREGEEPDCVTLEQSPGRCVFGPGSCTQDADCGEGYYCEMGDTARELPPSCPPDGQCPEPDGAEQVDREGWCEPAPLECEVNSDCPTPLTCQVQTDEDCSFEGEEEVCEEQLVTLCSFEFIECEMDADCDAGYECAQFDSGERCTASTDSEGSRCVPGEPCEAVSAPRPIEVECEPIQEQYCFPKRADCEYDGDCSNGWKCLDFSETYLLSEDYEDGEYAGPPWWQQEGESKAVACMPEGLIAVFNGQVWVESPGEASAKVANDAIGTLSEPQSAGQSRSDADDDESSKGGVGSCGCSVTPKTASSAYGLALIALVLAFRRKRRARPVKLLSRANKAVFLEKIHHIETGFGSKSNQNRFER